MITHPLIYCDWLEERGKDVTLLREDFESYSRDHIGYIEHFCLGCGPYGSASGDCFFDGYNCGCGWNYGSYFGDGDGGGITYNYSK